MAKVVDRMPGGPGRKKGSKYDRFLDGQVWMLERGVDWGVNTKIATVVVTLRGVARRQGKSVRVHTSGDGQLYVQAFTREEKGSGENQEG